MAARFSACIEMLFTHLPFLDRIDAAAAAGVQAVEFWGADGKDLTTICRRARALGLEVAAFACGAPLTDPDRGPQAAAALSGAVRTAEQHGIGRVIVTTGNAVAGRSRAEQEAQIVAGLRAAAPLAEEAGVSLLLEPLNTLVDHRGYFLDRIEPAVRIVRAVDSPAVRLLYDVYHMQIMEGNLIATIREHAHRFGHYHVADVPGRTEPGTGEVHYGNVVSAIVDSGFDGFIGLECRPRAGTVHSGDAVRAALGVMRGD